MKTAGSKAPGRSRILFVDLVDDTVLLGVVCIHEEVAINILLNLSELLASGLGEHFIEFLPGLQNVLSGDVDI